MILCIYARWRISQAEDVGSVLTPAVRRHIDSCAECRHFAGITRAIGSRLAAEAGSVCVPRELPVREWFGTPVMAYAAAGFAVMLCIGMIVAGLKFQPNSSSSAASGIAVQQAAIREQDLVLADATFFLEEPVFDELDALAQDASWAVQFMNGCLDSLM